MSFFNLTALGFQTYIREQSVPSKEAGPPRATKQFDYVALPPLKPKTSTPASILPINQTCGYGPGPEGSFQELTRLKIKHTRNPAGPQTYYFYPPTTNSVPGWWTKDSPIHVSKPWTYARRRPQINSEMSRFVNTMRLTHREFSLY